MALALHNHARTRITLGSLAVFTVEQVALNRHAPKTGRSIYVKDNSAMSNITDNTCQHVPPKFSRKPLFIRYNGESLIKMSYSRDSRESSDVSECILRGENRLRDQDAERRPPLAPPVRAGWTQTTKSKARSTERYDRLSHSQAELSREAPRFQETD